MGPSREHPAGVVGCPGWEEFDFSVNGVAGGDDRDWAAVILEKKVESLTPSLTHAYSQLCVLSSPGYDSAWLCGNIPSPGHLKPLFWVGKGESTSIACSMDYLKPG